jgi:hypothetical protein
MASQISFTAHAKDRRRTPGHHKAARPPDSERLRADKRKMPLQGGRGPIQEAAFRAGAALGRREQPAHEPLISRAMHAEVPLAGLSFDNFSVRWTGELEPRFSEDYQLIVEGDVASAVRIWIGGRMVLEDDGVSGRRAQRFGGGYCCRRSHSVPLPLKAGKRVPIKIEYHHGKGQAGIHLMWQSRTQDRQHVPTRHLFPPAVPR